jgi:hypothetical protein
MAAFVMAHWGGIAPSMEPKSGPKPLADAKPQYTTKSISGRVVWMAEALNKRFGITLVPEAADRLLALQTPEGTLYPIMEDLRGRSFRTDSRLREMDVQLLVRQYHGSPMVQVMRIYELAKEGKYELDYWCDVCAIVMYEFGPCACCQDQNRLRKRRVEK